MLADKQSVAGSTREINLPYILYRRRLQILGAALLAALCMLAYSQTLANRYSSIAALIVKDPELPLAGEERPLTIETLKFLVESTSVKKELYDQLTSGTQHIALNHDFRSFQRMLKVSAERKSTRDQASLPIMRLIVESESPELSRTIANLWTKIVMTRGRALYSGGVGELGEFISGISQQANSALLQSETQHTSAVLSANLGVNRAQLEQKQKLYAGLFEESLSLNEKLHMMEKLIRELEAQIGGLEIEGVWAGEYYDRFFRTQTGNTAIEPTTDTQQIHKTVQGLIRNERAIAQFEEESRLKFLTIDRSNKETQLAHISEQILVSLNRLAQAEKQQESLTAELGKMELKITLNKAVTDDAAWNAYFAELLKNDKNFPLMKSEVLNPVYQSVQQTVADLTGEISGLRGRIEYFDKQKVVLEKDVSVLSREIATKEAQLQAMQAAVKKDKDLLDYLEREFNKIRQRLDTLRRDARETRVNSNSKTAALAALETDIQRLERHVETSADQIDALQREVESRVMVATTIAAKAEEAALLKVTLADAGRSGIVLLYPAEADPEKTAPHRLKLVLSGALAGALLAAAWFVLAGTMREF